MKLFAYLPLFYLTLIVFPSFGQEQIYEQSEPIEKVEGNFLGLSIAMRDLPDADLTIEVEHDEGNIKENRIRPEAVNEYAIPKGTDPAIQTNYPKSNWELPMGVNFSGLQGAFPPDPSGAVSDLYYVQAVNTLYRVYNKNGTPASASKTLSSLWPGSSNSGDPIVMYDRSADKFVITQFQTGDNGILFAVSETNDPMGQFYLYEFAFPSFPDYPKYSIWSDGYYMTSNTYQKNVVAFEREKMINGDPTASMIALTLPSFSTGYGFRSVLPADADGDLPPYGTPNYMFLFQDDSWNGVTEDHIRILKMQVDWNTPSNSTIGLHQNLTTEPFNSVFTSSWDDITQKGTSQKLDAIASVFNYRAQYLRWPNYNTVMLCNVVDVNNANKGGIRWYELRQDEQTQEFSIRQQSTYSPSDGDSRFLGSISMDYNGHIGMAYSVSGPNNYPSLAFTGRFHWDALGDMSLPETFAQLGSTFQSGGNRFGDYAHMSLDPDGKTFWYTGEFIGTSGSRRTKIFSFSIEDIVGLSNHETDEPSIGLNQDASHLFVKGSELSNGEMYVHLFELNGKEIAEQVVNVVDGVLNVSFDKTNLISGVYLVRVGKENFQRVEKIVIQ